MTKVLADLLIKRFDDERWIVTTPDGRNVLLNEKAADLLLILRNSKSESGAIIAFQRHFGIKITQEQFASLVKDTFTGLNILENEQGGAVKNINYLSLKIPLLSEKYVGVLASPFKVLFLSSIFWHVFAILFFMNSLVCFLAYQKNFINLTNTNLMLVSFLVGASMLVHEFGHIAACRKFKVNHGAVGFGFYYIIPIMYADITKIWGAGKRQRLIANAGGIYFELIYTFFLFLLFPLTMNVSFLIAAISIFIKSAAQLNPFLRCDGYWLLSDISDTPNLMKKSSAILKNFVGNLKSYFRNLLKLKWHMSYRNTMLLMYGLTNTLLLLLLGLYVCIKFHSEIITFPAALLKILTNAFHLNLEVSDFPNGFIWVLGLYFFVLKIAIQQISKKINSKIAY